MGCGREAPLAKLLYSSKMAPAWYLGIDAGKIEPFNFGSKKDSFDLLPERDFPVWHMGTAPEALFTHIVCFEVLEHVEPERCIKILKGIYARLAEGAMAYISTPCWNGSAAGNHVNEMRHDVMGALLERHGFFIRSVFGTFASITDYVSSLTPGQREVFEDLREYYDTNVLSCLLAPLHPRGSRNCLWVVSKRCPPDRPFRYPYLKTIDGQWASSEQWKELAE